jgi:NitT/TauT family transport system ATP-binding protein
MSLISLDDISKNFGRNKVLQNISFSLEEGEIICLLGASGSGKTTLLNLLAGLETPTSGKITSAIKRPSPSIGYMQQSPSLLPWRTVEENIKLGLDLINHPVDEKKLNHWFSEIELKSHRHYYPHQISGGQKQRVALARTLLLSPQLLLLDEPLSALDLVLRDQLSSIIKKYIKETHSSAVVVTHSVEEAVYLADRVLILSSNPGKIIKEFQLSDGKIKGKIQREEALNEVFQALKESIRSYV